MQQYYFLLVVVSNQVVPSFLFEAGAEVHHTKYGWLQLNASLWARSESQGTSLEDTPAMTVIAWFWTLWPARTLEGSVERFLII